MKFIKIDIKNFLSLSTAYIEFKKGVHLIKGVNFDMGVEGEESNGAGKSSIMDALLWALFGELNRPDGKVNSVINQAAGSQCSVALEFEHEGKQVQINRYRKYSFLDDNGKLEKPVSGVSWWLDGKEMSAAKSKETQRELEEYLPVSVTVFKHAIQVGQGMPDRFLDLSESAKQDILCQMVDLQLYDTAQAEVKQRLAEIVSTETLTTGTLQGLQEQIERFKLELGGYRDNLARYEAQTGAQRAAQEAEAADLTKQIGAATGRLQALPVPSAEKITKLKAEVEISRGLVQKITTDGQGLKIGMEALEREKTRIISAIEEAKRDKNCITCGQPLPKGQTPADSDSRILSIDGEIADKARAKGRLIPDYKLLKLRFDAGQKMLAAAELQIRKAQAEIQSIQHQISGLTAKRDRVKDQLLSYERQTAHFKGKVEITEGSIEKMDLSINPQIEKLAELKNQRLHWEFWKDSIPNLRASAVEDVLGFINERLAHYMDIFSSGTMGVRLYQEAYGKGSKLKVELKTAADTYGMSSGGEKKRVDLAIYLSLSDLLQASAGLKCNILAADEICDGLSPLGVQQFLSVLRQKADEGTCVFVVSHNPSVSQAFEFDTIKTVEKKSGKAHLLPCLV